MTSFLFSYTLIPFSRGVSCERKSKGVSSKKEKKGLHFELTPTSLCKLPADCGGSVGGGRAEQNKFYLFA